MKSFTQKCILAVISANQARAALVESSGCSSVFAGMNTSETTTSHEVVDTSSFSVTEPADLLIETWGFSRAITPYVTTESIANIKVQIVIVTGGYPDEMSYSIDGGTSIESLEVGDNEAEYVLDVGAHVFTFVDSFGDGWNVGGYWQILDGMDSDALIAGGPVNGLVPQATMPNGGTANFDVTNAASTTVLTNANPLNQMTVKWRNSAVSEFTWTGSEAGGGETINTTDIAGTSGNAWINSVACLTYTSDDNDYFGGIQITTCDPSTITTKAACDGASTVDILPTTEVTGTQNVGTAATLTGPIVKISAKVGAYISDYTYWVWDDMCTDIKLTIPTWAFTSATLDQDWATGTTYGDLALADTDLSVANTPQHDLDVLNYQACTINFACDSANADMCATTSGTDIKILKSNPTKAEGIPVIINAFILDNTAAGVDGADHSTSATLTVNTKPDCSQIDAITAVSGVSLKVEASKTYSVDMAFTHNMSDWDAGVCGGEVLISGSNSSWATWTDGVATIIVPSSVAEQENPSTSTITFEYSETDDTNSATGTSASTATGSVEVVLEFPGKKTTATAGLAQGGATQMASQASIMVASVLGGAIFASVFMPAPAPTIPAANN